MTTPLLAVKDFSFSYDPTEKPVLQNLSFTVKRGETILVLGASGSGKSSLALCLNGLYPASVDGTAAGRIYLDGKLLEDYPPGEISRQIGVVFQDPDSQFCMLTVEDEVAFGLENIRLPREEIAGRIEWALALVGLQGMQSAPIASLSGGMKQKLALACVLAMKPECVILDEPTALLDPLATKEFAETIKKLQAELGFSLLVIEHKLDHWMSFMDRCFVLNNSGEIMFDGTAKDCFTLYLEELKQQGIWLPKPLLLGEQLNLEGQLPLTEEELLAAMNDSNFERLSFTEKKGMSRDAASIMEARHLSVSKGKKRILNNVSFHLPSGQLTAIVGPNGAGKTTLSYLLAGLEKPDSGEVLLKNSTGHATKQQKLGYVFQNPEHQFITDSVYEELAYSLRMLMKPEREIKQTVENVLTAFRLQHLADKHPYALSQGQKRRLSVATMLVDEQLLLLMDEPTYGQDRLAVEELMKMIAELLANGLSAVMITHDMELVAAFADHVIVLVAGEVLYEGSPQELFSGPDTLLETAQLERPLAYAIENKRQLRGESYAASYA